MQEIADLFGVPRTTVYGQLNRSAAQRAEEGGVAVINDLRPIRGAYLTFTRT